MNWHDLDLAHGVLELPESSRPDRVELELHVYWGGGEPTRAVWLWSQTGRMLTRRRFLRDLATGLLVAAAPVVAIEPERRWWAVPRNAPVPSRAPEWYEFESSRAIDGRRWCTNYAAQLLDVDRVPGEDDESLRARVLEQIQRPPMPTRVYDARSATIRLRVRLRARYAEWVERGWVAPSRG